MILLNPGPVSLSPRVRAALGRANWCHREPEFAELTRGLNRRLSGIHAALAEDYESVLLSGSGTAAVEAMLASFAPDSETTLVLANGVYGERMAAMLAAHGKPHEVLEGPWIAGPDLAAVEALLDRSPAITHLAAVHHETTTGRLTDLGQLGKLCRRRGIQLLLDAVSSFGAEAIEGATWSLKALAATANKCLHGAPGASFVLASHEAWCGPAQRAGSVYLDLRRYHETQRSSGYSPFTQAIPAFFALDEALAELTAAGGWISRQAQYRERVAVVESVLTSLGVTRLLPVEEGSCVLQSYRLPASITYETLHDRLKAAGFVIYAGQGGLAQEVFRLSFMGEIAAADLQRLCTALREVIAGA
ncbi:MAG: aminotransferase class V-fold PLP-dependent enzyme [Chromatiales bacterium]|nr:aminotransferase class V-fold PLP-dependent enzyme [Chromatiales bacterium]